MGSCSSDRNIALYDMRQAIPLKKVILDMRTNTICWDPVEALVFTAAKITTYILLYACTAHSYNRTYASCVCST